MNISNALYYYVLKIIYPNYPLYTFPLFIKLCVFSSLFYKRNQPLKLKLRIIPAQLYENFVHFSSENNLYCDKNSVLIVSQFVYKYLTNKSKHNWVKLSQNPISGTTRIVAVKPSNCCFINNIIISENSYFNLKRFFKESNDIDTIVLEIFKGPIPSVANEVLLSFIKCPLEVPKDLQYAVLGTYFSSPKLVYIDDIHEIILNHETGGNSYYKYMNICDTLKSIHFKCINICGTRNTEMGYFIVKDITTIQEQQNISSLLPKKSFIYAENSIFDEQRIIKYYIQQKSFNISNICPDGLMQYYEIVIESLESFMGNHCLLNILPVFLIQGPKGVGKSIILESVSKALGIRQYNIDCSEIMCPTTAQTESKIKYIFERAKIAAPVMLCMHSFEVFGVDHENELDMRLINMFQEELKSLLTNNDNPIIMIATYNSKIIPATLQRIFLETIVVKPPSEIERQQILKWIFQTNDLYLNNKIIENLSSKTAGFLYEDLKLLVTKYMKSVSWNNNVIDENIFDYILGQMHNSYADSIGAPKVPKVYWSDIGGLADLKEEIIKSIKNPTGGLDLLNSGNSKRSGILLYGPPGTGKTLLAKAIATESKFNFLSVKGPELLNMYVGQSEQNVRDVFERARAATPCVIFFDELDSLAPNRGAKGDSGGVMDSIVAQLLSEMDCIGNDLASHTLFIVGATNRPDLLDPALLRPGRLDKLLYVGLCDSTNSKAIVLKTILKKFNLDSDVEIEKLAHLLKYSMSGADLHSICSKAWMNAARQLLKISNKDVDLRQQYTAKDVKVSMADFEISINQFVPSVSLKDMAYFKQMQKSNDANTYHDKKKYMADDNLNHRATS